MYKELERDSNVEFTRPNHGCLEGWAKQGVLLLNSTLTTRCADSTREAVNSHVVNIFWIMNISNLIEKHWARVNQFSCILLMDILLFYFRIEAGKS